MQNGSSVGMRTRCTRVFARFAPILYAQSVLINEIPASELSRKFTKSALLAGQTVWQSKRERERQTFFSSPFPFHSKAAVGQEKTTKKACHKRWMCVCVFLAFHPVSVARKSSFFLLLLLLLLHFFLFLLSPPLRRTQPNTNKGNCRGRKKVWRRKRLFFSPQKKSKSRV